MNMKKHLQMARLFTQIMDDQFSLFGVRFGLDAVLGIIPGSGDVVSLFLSMYVIWIAHQMHVPAQLIGKMLMNVFIDFGIGIFPFVGDIGDIFFKANVRNLQLLEDFDKNVVEAEIIE